MLKAIKINNSLTLKTTQAVLDTFILSASFVIAYLLRFDFLLPPTEFQKAMLHIALVVPLELLILYAFGVHRFIWRYVSIRETKRIVLALATAAGVFIVLRLLSLEDFGWSQVPLSISIFNFCLASVGILSVRLLRREMHEKNRRTLTGKSNETKKTAVLLIGAGRAGIMTLAEIKSRGDINIDVRGFVDDDPKKKNAIINGVKILGNSEQLPRLVRELKIDHVIISMAQASREDFQRILNICRSVPVKVRTVPGLFELLQEKVTVSRIRDIEIEDLLGRPSIQLDTDSVQHFLRNKVVLVTGAGGSIGSEIVRQLTCCNVKQIIMVERSEYALFQIEREINQKFPDVKFVPVIADICDSIRMTKIFEKFRPQIIFHAAAHKHVPMMEINPAEAVKNNIFGTESVARLSGQFDVEAFVLISTDKAVNPTSIMGATKRVAELVIQDLNSHFKTRYVAVRFGNVIGSNGSVIPTFREQIRKGGPVTVTHPEMKRFFMTIPEATQLVLQAGAIGAGGEILVLDMGEPVKIVDLARETIKLSGLRPDIDMKIVYTGIRPGEKLSEELQYEKEQLSRTIHPKIFLGEIKTYQSSVIREMMDELKRLSISEDDVTIRTTLSCYLPEANLDFKVESTLNGTKTSKNLIVNKGIKQVAAA